MEVCPKCGYTDDTSGCPHPPEKRMQYPATETFESREGCLACDRWLQPVRLKYPIRRIHDDV